MQAGSLSRFRVLEGLGRLGNIPEDVHGSFDWGARTDPSWPVIHPTPAQLRKMENLVEHRGRVLHFEHKIPKEFSFDMAYVRWPGELAYVWELHDLLKSGVVYQRGGVHGDLLCYKGSLVTESRQDVAYLVKSNYIDLTMMPDLEYRDNERRWRHRCLKLVPGHCL